MINNNDAKHSMIFHIPWEIRVDRASASQIRPLKMIDAFEKIGYNVEKIVGNAKTRKEKIRQIKNNIKNGVRYDFLYSESSTFPTIIANSNKDAIKFPFIDFRFFSFCHKKSIPIGLFYRDIYWRFSDFKVMKHSLKKYYYKFLYRFDLVCYNKYVDILYLPSLNMKDYLDYNLPEIKDLPPGCEKYDYKKSVVSDKINLLYVGGLGTHYNIDPLMKSASKNPHIHLFICCRKSEWEKKKEKYRSYLNDNIEIFHLKDDGLEKIYDKTDIGIIFIKKHVYWDFAMPLKLFEYLGHYKPVICTNDTSVSAFIKRYDVGWSISYNNSDFEKLLEKIIKKPGLINDKQENIRKIINDHTWKARASKVSSDLTDIGGES